MVPRTSETFDPPALDMTDPFVKSFHAGLKSVLFPKVCQERFLHGFIRLGVFPIILQIFRSSFIKFTVYDIHTDING